MIATECHISARHKANRHLSPEYVYQVAQRIFPFKLLGNRPVSAVEAIIVSQVFGQLSHLIWMSFVNSFYSMIHILRLKILYDDCLITNVFELNWINNIYIRKYYDEAQDDIVRSCGVVINHVITKIGTWYRIKNYLDFFVTCVTRPKFCAKFLQHLAAIPGDEDELLASSFFEDIGNNCTSMFN